MTVISVHKDVDALTMTVTTKFAASPERVWTLWANPRLLERWWGPPMFPATFVEHEFVMGGRVTYFMTGPSGEKHHGWWRITELDAPRAIAFEDGFADSEGKPNPALPTTRLAVTIRAEADGTTIMELRSSFSSRENMDALIQMGMEEGFKQALSQIDAILAG
jgi:uncharacterized protein YndB with AHSA1/START domain